MTITDLTLPALKKVKNAVIGNPLAKLLIVQDDAFIRMYVPSVALLCSVLTTLKPGCRLTDTLNHSTNDALCLEATHLIVSLAFGSGPSFAALLHHQTAHALLYALTISTSPHIPLPSHHQHPLSPRPQPSSLLSYGPCAR